MMIANWKKRTANTQEKTQENPQENTQEEIQQELTKYLEAQTEFIAPILARRGVSKNELATIYNPKINNVLPDPAELPNISKALELLLRAITEKEEIAIISDWDADGATSAALLGKFLSSVGAKFFLQIPSRLKDGYGPSKEHVDTLHQRGIKLLVTADCGTTSHSVMEHARNLGIKTIVIDHHQPHRQDAQIDALVNPMLIPTDSKKGSKGSSKGSLKNESSDNPLKSLAAAGVVFLVMVGLNRLLRQKGFYQTKPEPNLYEMLDLVAIATICDMMPITPLNRVLIRCGLRVLGKWQNTGLKALASVAEVAINKPLTPLAIAFMLGPRLNAGGRVGESSLASKLLLCQDSKEAMAMAEVLEQHNQERKQLQEDALQFATLQAESKQVKPALVVSGDWHAGVVGLVAGNLAERWQKPTFAFAKRADGVSQGSARAAGRANVGNIASEAVLKGLATKGGGHKEAAGITTHTAKLAALEKFINHAIKAQKPPANFYDCVTTPQILLEHSEALARLAPFGSGFPTPLFLLNNVVIESFFVTPYQIARLNIVKVGEKKVRATARGTNLIAMLEKASTTPSPLSIIASVEVGSYGATLIIKDGELVASTAKPK